MTGQEHILNYLKKSIDKGRIGHAYLFVGPEYLKKRDMALWFVRSLGCQEPDINEIPTSSKISIEQIRKLRRHLSLSPHSSPYKATIINSAERMTTEAANALLKTLEEPRGNTVLILLTSIPSKLPDTILSRCEEIKFKAGSLDKVSNQFMKKEYIDILQKPLNDIFKFVEQISKDGSEIVPVLDSWLFWFRETVRKNAQHTKTLKEIQRIKFLILNTNVNQRLALENLVLCIKK